MIARLILLAFVFCGCTSEPRQGAISSPSVSHADQMRADQIARQYATHTLGLTQAQVARMKADFTGFDIARGRELTIQFYDSEVFHPNADGLFEAMMGGFPSYFRITVDIQTWSVIHHYASSE